MRLSFDQVLQGLRAGKSYRRPQTSVWSRYGARARLEKRHGLLGDHLIVVDADDYRDGGPSWKTAGVDVLATDWEEAGG